MSPNSIAGSRSLLAAPRVASAERGLFVVVASLCAATFWLAPRLPMVDLPQHAGQVALWRDLILGVSPFAGDLWINLFTPYLLGYGLALPFAFVLDPADALRIVLAASFLAFAAAARRLRADLDADARVDWLFLFGFFGVAWHWGLYTFLVAAPATLWTIRAMLRFDARPGARAGAAVVAIGVALLFCHGLQFLFALAVGGAVTLERALRERGARAALAVALRRCGPYVALALAFALFMVLRAVTLGPEPSSPIDFGAALWSRPSTALMHVWGTSPDVVFVAATVVAFAAPLRMGLAPARGPGLAMFLVVVAIQLFGVSIALNTGLLYERFALYLAPFWALALRPAVSARATREAHVALVACALLTVAAHAWRVAAFAREDRDFDAILAAVNPGERALSLVIDTESDATSSPRAYMHWPVWMQNARGAFVDFNFAVFHPQIVRFRPGHVPAAAPQQGESAQSFDWAAWNAERYDIYVVRGSQAMKEAFFLSRAPQAMAATATAADWTVYRKAAPVR